MEEKLKGIIIALIANGRDIERLFDAANNSTDPDIFAVLPSRFDFLRRQRKNIIKKYNLLTEKEAATPPFSHSKIN